MLYRKIFGIFSLIAITGLISVLLFVPTMGEHATTSQPTLKRFLSYEELVSFLNRSSHEPFYFGYRINIPKQVSLTFTETDFDSVSAPDFSKTNTQVEGVDEADIVKCDGMYLYLVSEDEVLIVKAYPPHEAELAARIDLGNYTYARGVFVYGDKLVILAESSIFIYSRYIAYGSFQVLIKIYDVKDRREPVLLRNISVNGSLFDSRMIGNYIYVLINTPAYLQDGEVPLPQIFHNGHVERIEASSIYYSNISDYYYTFTTILAINVQNDEEEISRETLLLGYASALYVSQSNIYVTIPKYGYYEAEKTEVHRIRVENGETDFEASGEVPGYVLNQFSMDEYNGYFRIATTSSDLRSPEYLGTQNNVYVLDLNLTVVGKLENLAPGERIYSARFMGERCYLVTFKKVDPLFVISLEDPVNPTILGKLKIPGYSDYLHPYDENHLIGIGKWTVEAEEGDFAWYQGVKISLFDLKDVEHPKEISNFTIGNRGTDSPVLRDHKALLFERKRNLLALPVLVAEIDEDKYPGGVPPNAYGDYVWQGVYVFNITENSITLRGGVTHLKDQTDLLKSGYYFSSEYSVERALYIDDVLYTISNRKIKMNNLTDLEEINEVELP